MFMKFFLESINILFTANKISCFYIITMIFPRQKYLKTSLHTRPLHVFFQFSSVAQSCLTLCDSMDCSTQGFPVHHQLLELAQTHGHRVGDAGQTSHPLLSPSLPAFNLYQHQGVFKWSRSLHQVAKVLEFQLWHQSFQWLFRTDFFRIHWLNLLAVQGTLKNLLQHLSSKASILWCSAFFIIQLSQTCMTTGKTIALTIWTFVSKVMSLLFNMLSGLIIAFLLKSKCLLISWLHSQSAVILFPHLFSMKWWDWMPWSSFFTCWVLNQLFHSRLSLSRGSLIPLRSLP